MKYKKLKEEFEIMHQNEKQMLIQVFLTASETGDRLAQKEPLYLEPDVREEEMNVVNVYDDVKYQEIIGFGGAFTEAAADTFYKMSPEKREEILQAYFHPETGLGYTFCRTHINSCDFALGNYAYVEKPGDTSLETFTLERDEQSLLPFIKEALQHAGTDMKLFASPWSPPAWMKTNGQMNEGGKLKEKYYIVWAKYFAKYIRSYEDQGVHIWGITVQNEPKAVQRWDSCVYTAQEEADFVKNYLGPVLEAEGLSHVKIMIWDHNKERIYERAKVAFEDADTSRYIWGVGFHWYSGDHFEALEAVNHRWPDKKLVFTEGCKELGPSLGAWSIGERYGHDILGDLKHHTCAWTDWNLILNEQGGPNHVHNYCDAPIIANTQNDTVHYEVSYYYIGHFSRFIRPGSIRIASTSYTEKLETVAFLMPEGKKVLIVMNRTEETLPFGLRYQGMISKGESLPHSIMTLVF